MDKGWIKLQRSIADNWIYNAKPFDKCHAWIDLLLLAEHKTHKKMWRGNITEFRRGDVCLSIEKLGIRWGWSRKKVRHFLEQLEGDGMVHLKAHRNRTVITLVNYSVYQDKGTSKGTSEGTSKDTSDGTSEVTSEGTYLKNVKNDKEEKNIKAPAEQKDPIEEELDYLYDLLDKLPLDSEERKQASRRIGELETDE